MRLWVPFLATVTTTHTAICLSEITTSIVLSCNSKRYFHYNTFPLTFQLNKSKWWSVLTSPFELREKERKERKKVSVTCPFPSGESRDGIMTSSDLNVLRTHRFY
jgi:hypothetical protein